MIHFELVFACGMRWRCLFSCVCFGHLIAALFITKTVLSPSEPLGHLHQKLVGHKCELSFLHSLRYWPWTTLSWSVALQEAVKTKVLHLCPFIKGKDLVDGRAGGVSHYGRHKDYKDSEQAGSLGQHGTADGDDWVQILNLRACSENPFSGGYRWLLNLLQL